MLFLITCSSDKSSPTEPTPDPPVASFTLTPASGYAPLPVQFTSTSTGDITAYAWDFQNNLTTESTEQNPAYTYTTAGVYSIRLTVGGPGGSSFVVQENSLTVLQAEAPAVESINQTTSEDTPISITLTGTDPQDLPLTYSITTLPDNGQTAIDGTILTYTPNTDWNGTENFNYKANNGYIDSNEGAISITVEPTDDEPNTLDVSATTDEDTAISIVLSANEVDGDSYSFSIIDNPANGSVSLSGNTVVYTPNTNWNGTDVFTFEATDDRIMFSGKIINVGTATVTVNPINDAPVAENVSQSTVENNAVDITLDASDVENDNLTYSVISSPSNGSVTISGSTASYTPNQDWNGTDTFT